MFNISNTPLCHIPYNIEFICSQIEPFQYLIPQTKYTKKKKWISFFFSQMNIFVFFSSRSLSFIVVVVFIDVHYLYIYISIDGFFLLPIICLCVCECMYVSLPSCDYFSSLCIVICVRMYWKQITLSEFFHISVYRFFFTSVAAIELFTFVFFLKRPTNVHCDWCVSSFSFSLALFLLLSDDVLCL